MFVGMFVRMIVAGVRAGATMVLVRVRVPTGTGRGILVNFSQFWHFTHLIELLSPTVFVWLKTTDFP